MAAAIAPNCWAAAAQVSCGVTPCDGWGTRANADGLPIVAADRRQRQYSPPSREELEADAIPDGTDVERVTVFAMRMNGYGLIGRWRLQDEVHRVYLAWRETDPLPHDLTRLRA